MHVIIRKESWLELIEIYKRIYIKMKNRPYINDVGSNVSL